MNAWYIFLNWLFFIESVHAVVTWTTPTNGQSISKAENTTVNTVIVTLVADNATTYTLVSQTPDTGKFDIPTNTSKLKLNATLDFETEKSYTLVLRADDGTGQNADITYTVNVTDVNEAPVFSPTSASQNVESGTSSGTIYDVSQNITDPEEDAITYSISGSDLSVDTNGAVSPNTTLNYDPDSPSITATVTARDDEFSATFNLTINIRTVPVFNFTSNPMDFPESSAAGSTLYTYAYTDDDGDTSPTFSITAQSVDGTFEQRGNTAIVVASGRSFDFEGNTTQYNISMQAVDASGFTGTATLTVNITNVNDENPKFTSSADPVYVPETTATGTSVYTVQATDDGDSMNYIIVDGNTGNDFQIANSSTGTVTVANTLSFTRTSEYNLVFQADDGSQQSNQTVMFNIKTVPQLTLPESNTKEIMETVSIGHTVYTFEASDADGDTSFTYSIVGQSGKFDVNADSTAVVTKAEFDYENGNRSFTITLKAVDTSGFTGTSTLTVNIINVNDENPEFTSSADPVSVPETATTGTTVYTVQATDDGDSMNYIIVDGNTGIDFQIANSSTGTVTVANTLSFTRTSEYNLVFQADDGSQQTNQTVMFNIKTAPQLTLPESNTKEIMETVSIGHTVYTFEASDADSDTSFTYSIVEQSDDGKFDVNADSTAVVTKAEFDYENGDRNFTITLNVSDTFPLTSTAVLTVTIVDANDNTPEFNPTSYNASLKENLAAQPSIAHVTATDADAGDTITYSFASGNDSGLFSIGEDTGVVGTTGALDFESGATLSLVVAATDSGGNVGSAALNVTVIQETNPVFINPSGLEGATINIAESTSIDTSVYKLLATDGDGDNLTFVFTNDNNEFDLETNQDITVAAALDYETNQSFQLKFEVTDENLEVVTSSATLTVSIEDVNDNPPVFTETSYSGSVLEKQTSALTVATLEATDADSSLNNYDVIEYSITDGNSANHFTINPSTGVLTAINLNYATATSHILEVTAKDLNGSEGALEANVTVNVDVKTQPVWTEPNTENKEYNVDEDIAVDGIVVQLAATDADSSGNLKYSVKSQTPTTPEDLFVIETDTRDLKRGATDLDVDDVENAITNVTLVLSVTDETHTVNRTIVININDINDNSPVFNPSSYSPFIISENAAIGDSVGTVTATDDDLDEANNQITYSLSGTNFEDFVMSTTVPGQINTVTTTFTSTLYTLNVTASDGANSNTLNSITIIVKSDPEWTAPASPGIEIDVLEGSTSNVSLLQSSDKDGDTPEYTIVSQSPTSPGTFTLDDTTNGQINAAGLDVDAKPHVTRYTLNLRLSDGTTEVNSSVVLNIQDVNDNDPVFNPTSYTFDVKDTSPIDTVIGAVTATDEDYTASVTYSLSGTGYTDFEIDDSTGDITLKAQLNYTITPSYSLNATASDGTKSQTASVTVNVKTAPTWAKPASADSVSKAENVNSAEVFYTISATDADSDTLTYSIKTQTVSDFFKLGSASGRDVLLNTSKELDYEITQQYKLTFEVKDGTYDPIESAQLVITVTDVNDNKPTFTPADINVIVKDTHSVGDTIKTLTATDADSSLDDNNVLTYSIYSGNDDGDFAITTSGVVTLAKTVSSGSIYTIVVHAVDGGSPALTGSATLNVTTATASDPVLNELAPSTTHTVSINEDDAVGTSVYEIDASDSDGDTLLYTIKTQTPSVKFALNNNVLQISAPLDYDTEMSYTLVFEVDDDDDNTGNKLTSGTLTITVTDVNDHYPTFPQEVYTVDIMEKRTEVVNVVKLTATDADSDKSSNGAVAYTIVGGDLFDQFTIDANSGQLATKNVGLLRSKQKYHVLAIQAKDAGMPVRADSVHVIVNVTPFQNGSSNQKLCVIMFAILLLCSLQI